MSSHYETGMSTDASSRSTERMTGSILSLLIKKFQTRAPGTPDPIAMDPAQQQIFAIMLCVLSIKMVVSLFK